MLQRHTNHQILYICFVVCATPPFCVLGVIVRSLPKASQIPRRCISFLLATVRIRDGSWGAFRFKMVKSNSNNISKISSVASPSLIRPFIQGLCTLCTTRLAYTRIRRCLHAIRAQALAFQDLQLRQRERCTSPNDTAS
jgi:hypothetical protein